MKELVTKTIEGVISDIEDSTDEEAEGQKARIEKMAMLRREDDRLKNEKPKRRYTRKNRKGEADGTGGPTSLHEKAGS